MSQNPEGQNPLPGTPPSSPQSGPQVPHQPYPSHQPYPPHQQSAYQRPQGYAQQQYAQWYDPHAGPSTSFTALDKKQLLIRPEYRWLLVSAGLYLLISVLQWGGQLTPAYRDSLGSFAGPGTSGPETVVAVLGNLVSFGIIFGLYALVFFPLVSNKNWARVVGMVFASMGVLAVLLNLITVGLYGWFGIVIAVAIVGFAVVNVLWIIAAARTWDSSTRAPYPYRLP